MQVDDAARVQQAEVSHDWWREIGPDRIAEALQLALNRATDNRLTNWSNRVAEREHGEVPTGWRPKVDGRVAEKPGRDVGQGNRYGEVARMLELLGGVRSEIDGLRQRLDAQAAQQVIGRSAGSHVTVAMTGGQVTAVQISRRWLNEQPSGQAIAEEFRLACHNAYRQAALQSAAALAAAPSLATLRDLASDPATLLRRLGLSR
ncbi:MAG TPA: hypothetical protein VFX61_09530 [Micromonosporaceae bacterium]|nr:hypothetical protein [Micromonosporaceae bacterium]